MIKNVLFIAIMATSFALFSCAGDDKAITETEFHVRGNCSMCKKRIETALKETKGVLKADWNVKSKNVIVAYDSTKIQENMLHQIVANTGHETKLYPMDEVAHDALPQCCQKYNHGHDEDDHDGHDHAH
ncbi:MAG: heavy-metal-associated domain-containing protein [Cytophagaceae bacterium]